VGFGHQRWDIENYGFKELANEWHSDHVFMHDPIAIECFLLVAFLAYNLFHAFFALNLKPALRQGRTQPFRARLMAAELHQEVRLSTACRPEHVLRTLHLPQACPGCSLPGSALPLSRWRSVLTTPPSPFSHRKT
jgi:hypothetical protein